MKVWSRLSILLFLILFTSISITINASTKLDKLEKKVAASHKRPLKLSSSLYKELTKGPRDYGLFVILTAMSQQHNCEPCKKFDVDYRLITTSWLKANRPKTMYFATLDFTDGMDVFQSLGLTTAPFGQYFPPTQGPLAKSGQDASEPVSYDFNRNGITVEAFLSFIKRETGIDVKIVKPTDYSKIFFLGGTGFIGLVLLKLFHSYLALIYENKKLWSIISIATIILMSSGHMWNHIRNPPYAGKEMFAPGFQQQYVGETQAVGILYALIAVVFVAMVTKVPTLKNSYVQQVTTVCLVVLFLTFYSLLLSTFKKKNGGYPLRLFF